MWRMSCERYEVGTTVSKYVANGREYKKRKNSIQRSVAFDIYENNGDDNNSILTAFRLVRNNIYVSNLAGGYWGAGEGLNGYV